MVAERMRSTGPPGWTRKSWPSRLLNIRLRKCAQQIPDRVACQTDLMAPMIADMMKMAEGEMSLYNEEDQTCDCTANDLNDFTSIFDLIIDSNILE
jgi:hypothetical protein